MLMLSSVPVSSLRRDKLFEWQKVKPHDVPCGCAETVPATLYENNQFLYTDIDVGYLTADKYLAKCSQ